MNAMSDVCNIDSISHTHTHTPTYGLQTRRDEVASQLNGQQWMEGEKTKSYLAGTYFGNKRWPEWTIPNKWPIPSDKFCSSSLVRVKYVSSLVRRNCGRSGLLRAAAGVIRTAGSGASRAVMLMMPLPPVDQTHCALRSRRPGSYYSSLHAEL